MTISTKSTEPNEKSPLLELSISNSHPMVSTALHPGGDTFHVSNVHNVEAESERSGHDQKEEDDNDVDDGRSVFLRLLSGRRKYTMMVVALASLLGTVTFSLTSPFYPIEAERKGMDDTTIGFVFGVFELVIFLTAPIFGNCLVRLGPKFVYISGILVGSCCNVLFGSLQFCPGGTPFIVLSVLIRSTCAVGYSASTTAGFAIVSHQFSNNIGLIIGILKTCSSLGLMAGPTLGSVFYSLGGFGLPFYVTGGASLLNAIAVYKVLPPVDNLSVHRRGSMLSLLRSPMVVIPMFSIFFGMVGLTTFESTFSKHIEPLDLSIGMVGALFAVMAFFNSIMCTIWGYLSDAKNIQAPIIIFGHLTFGLGYLVLGPSFLLPFIPFNLVTTFVGLVCIGGSLGCTFIPTMKCMVIGSSELGFEGNVDTYGLVSGLFTSIQTLGGFIGPVGVGYLVQKFDFSVAYSTVGLFHLFVMVLSSVFFILRRVKGSPNDNKV